MVDHLFVVNIRVNLHFIYGKCSENELKIFECFTSVPSSRGGFGGLSPPNKRPSPQIEIWNTINHWRFYQVFNINPPGISAKPPPHTHELKAPLVKTSWRRFCFTYSSHKFCPPFGEEASWITHESGHDFCCHVGIKHRICSVLH